MTFRHPLLLWGMLLGLIPILIQLLSRRRYRVVPWAATDFLLAAASERSRRVRLQDAVLLTLRVLIFVAVALALSGPMMRGGQAQLASARPTDAVLILDNSPTMGTRADSRTRLQFAQQRAREILAGLPAGSRFAVVALADPSRLTNLSADPISAAAAVEAVRLSAETPPAPAAITRALEVLAGSSAATQQIYLITDLNAAAWSPTQPLRRAFSNAAPAVQFTIVQVPNTPVANLAVADLALAGMRVQTGSPLRLRAVIRDTGDPPAASTDVTLWVDGIQTQQQRVDLDNRTGTADFEHAFATAGLHTLEARLPTDGLELDNHRFSAVFVPENIPVAVVASPGQNSARVFLRAAIESLNPPGDPHTLKTVEELTDAWAAILPDPGPLSAETVAHLQAAAESGMSFCVTAGPHSQLINQPGAQAREFFELEAQTKENRQGSMFLPQSWLRDLSIAARQQRAGGSPLRIERPMRTELAASQPALTFNTPELAASLSAARFYETSQLAVASDQQWNITLRYDNGLPALLTRDAAPGRPRLALLTSSLDPAWSDLAYRPALVPLVDRVLAWLIWPRLAASSLHSGEEWKPAVLIGPETRIITPDGQAIPSTAWGNAEGKGTLRFDQMNTPGVYHLVQETGRMPAYQGDARSAVAVNVDPAGVSPDLITPAQLTALLPSNRFTVLHAAETPSQPSQETQDFSEAFAILAALCILAELILAHFLTPVSTRRLEIPFPTGGRP